MVKATICPRVMEPEITWRPPTQITATIPTFTHADRSGVIVAISLITREVSSVKRELARSKRASSRSARTKDLIRRTPAMFSWMMVFSLSSLS